MYQERSTDTCRAVGWVLASHLLMGDGADSLIVPLPLPPALQVTQGVCQVLGLLKHATTTANTGPMIQTCGVRILRGYWYLRWPSPCSLTAARYGTSRNALLCRNCWGSLRGAGTGIKWEECVQQCSRLYNVYSTDTCSESSTLILHWTLSHWVSFCGRSIMHPFVLWTAETLGNPLYFGRAV